MLLFVLSRSEPFPKSDPLKKPPIIESIKDYPCFWKAPRAKAFTAYAIFSRGKKLFQKCLCPNPVQFILDLPFSFVQD
jgi:hypothetical protein